MGGRLSAIRVASRLEGLADNAQGRNSSCPGGFPGLEEDSYLKLRSGFLREFKSMSALFQRCQPALEAGLGRDYHCKFTLSRTFSSGSQLVALELRNCHVLIIFNAKSITSTTRLTEVFMY